MIADLLTVLRDHPGEAAAAARSIEIEADSDAAHHLARILHLQIGIIAEAPPTTLLALATLTAELLQEMAPEFTAAGGLAGFARLAAEQMGHAELTREAA